MSLSRRCFLAAGIFAALSCNGDRPTQPSTDTPTPGPQFSSTQIGGGTLGTPGTTTGGGGATGWTPMSATVPNAFILVQVTGTINIATNQACTDTFTLPCQYPLSGENVGPMGDKYGWLKVSVREVGGSTVPLGAVPNTNMAQGLIFGMGGMIQASRTGAAQNGQSCMANPVHPGDVTNCPKVGDTKTYVEVGSYLLIGSQTITIMQIDPFSVQASASNVLQGAPVTFTATVDPNAPAVSMQWYWVPGETGVGQDGNPNSSLTGGSPVSCPDPATCTYTPLTSGRMYMLGKVIGHWTHKGVSVTVNPITLTATPGTAYAMDQVTFTATIGGGLTVSSWSFAPDPVQPNVVSAALASAGPIAPAQAMLRRKPHLPGTHTTGGPEYFLASGPNACQGGYNDCEAPVPVSGTETITVTISGTKVKTSTHVVLQPDALSINPSSATKKPGEAASFEATTASGKKPTVKSWTWTPSSAPTMGPPLTAVPTSDKNNCGTNTKCTINVYESGTLTVSAVLPGQSTATTATATITITQCLPTQNTDDERIADPGFRKGLADALDAGPSREPGGHIFKNPTDGTYRAIPYPPDPTLNPCSYWPASGSLPITPIPPGYVIDTKAEWHDHIHKYGDPVPASCGGGGKGTAGRGPSYCEDATGVASCDWGSLVKLQKDGYLLDPDGDLYRWGDIRDFYPNPTIWHRDGKSICFDKKPPIL